MSAGDAQGLGMSSLSKSVVDDDEAPFEADKERRESLRSIYHVWPIGHGNQLEYRSYRHWRPLSKTFPCEHGLQLVFSPLMIQHIRNLIPFMVRSTEITIWYHICKMNFTGHRYQRAVLENLHLLPNTAFASNCVERMQAAIVKLGNVLFN